MTNKEFFTSYIKMLKSDHEYLNTLSKKKLINVIMKNAAFFMWKDFKDNKLNKPSTPEELEEKEKIVEYFFNLQEPYSRIDWNKIGE